MSSKAKFISWDSPFNSLCISSPGEEDDEYDVLLKEKRAQEAATAAAAAATAAVTAADSLANS